MGMPWQVTKLAICEDNNGMVGYEISMFHRKMSLGLGFVTENGGRRVGKENMKRGGQNMLDNIFVLDAINFFGMFNSCPITTPLP
jgi:hypothetical protein